ncbi:scoloptoxin SSD14-like [Adelges cooleyi]|uniref:scoloptoxin SSD14-like n=1 Tax=Adelges cooleyi TaxID=133065 RepID=UPI00217F7ACC|nr:scoloptoxin SSD14-like [Adelges cooleyi]
MTLYNSETKTPMTIDAREVAPAAATPSMFCKNQINSQIGSLAIGVPGQLKGYWTAFNKFGGGVSWKSLFEPAIQMCEEGISISKRLETNICCNKNAILKNDILREYFLNKETGTLKKMGDRFRMLKLAETLKIIALNGADYFYNGPLASRIANEVQNAGGILSFKDLNDYTPFL